MNIDTIVMIDSPRGNPDRGWSPTHVVQSLRARGVPCEQVHVRSPDELKRLFEQYPSGLYWPLNYTYSLSNVGQLIVQTLHEAQRPYLTCDPRSARYTSKLQFKSALSRAGIATPGWVELREDDSLPNLPTQRMPCFVKTEYSCDSLGVRMADDDSSLRSAIDELRANFDDQLFVEDVGGQLERTIACLLIGDTLTTAAISMQPMQARYIDAYAKRHNESILISKLHDEDAHALHAFAERMTKALGLTGYFRIDVLVTGHAEIQAIDMNVLPFLSADAAQTSYIPLAFKIARGCQYTDLLGGVLGTATLATAKFSPGSALEAFVNSSSLVRTQGST